MTPAPQGANLLWILSGEQFSLYEKGKKDKKPPLQRFANFSETLAPAYLSRYAERRGESVVCVLLRIPSQLRTFTGFFIRFRPRPLNCLNASPAPFSSRRAEPCPVPLFIPRRADRRSRRACVRRLSQGVSALLTTSIIRRGGSLSASRG